MRAKLGEIKLSSWRFYFLVFFILAVVLGLIARMVDLAVIERHFLQTQGNARTLRVISEPAFRGMITDRDGYPLAISASVFSVWVNPQEFQADATTLNSLAHTLQLNPREIKILIDKYKKKGREFTYLKRELSPADAKLIRALKIPGIYLQQSYKRFYPEGEVVAHVLGFTNVDDKGQEGLELAYNDWLAGMPGKKQVIKDRLGRVINDVQKIQDKKSGHDLVLSINRKIQYLAYRELAAGVQENKAESGSVVVLDVKTGEVLAMVNQPSFNPNHVSAREKNNLRNRAVTDTFEPGSTIKSFSLTSALESGKFTPQSVIDTSPGWIQLDHHIVHDEHKNGLLTLTQILQLSSNVGVSKIILQLPPNQIWNLLHRLGFGEITGIGFPGEQAGRLVPRSVWKPLAIATLSFGYGISVTTLQLAHAYATLANDGIKIPLSLLRVSNPPVGERVVSKKVAAEMVEILQSVLAKGGTGYPARVPGYRVAGKTGTAWVAGNHGYEKHRYTSSFVGFAPATHARLVVAVVMHNPQGKQYFGGFVSGPVFEKIMEGSLRILNIPPDDPDSLPPAASELIK